MICKNYISANHQVIYQIACCTKGWNWQRTTNDPALLGLELKVLYNLLSAKVVLG